MGKTNKDNSKFEKEVKPKKVLKTVAKKTKKSKAPIFDDLDEDFLKMEIDDYSYIENDNYDDYDD
jgi:hypothetical protein